MTWNAGVATMSWTIPNNTTGSPLDNYQYSINGGSSWSSVNRGAMSSFTFGQTISEVTYLLKGRNSKRHNSRASSYTLLAGNAPGESQPPSSFVYSHAKGAGVLTWAPPQDTGGVPLVDYEAKAQLMDSGLEWLGLQNLTSHDFIGMPIGQEQFRYIRAKNAAGKVSGEVLSPTVTPSSPSISDFYISYQGDFVAEPSLDVPFSENPDYRVTRIDLVWEGVESVNDDTPVGLYETNHSKVLDTSVELVAVKISPRYSDPDANGVTNNILSALLWRWA